MQIVNILIIVFIVTNLLIFTFIYYKNKQESAEEKINFFMILITTIILALILTTVIGLILFVLLGSANTINLFFSLNISMNQLITLSVLLFVYLYTIDSIIEIAMQHILGKNIFSKLGLFLTRIVAFHLLGKLINLNENISFKLALGIALIIFFIETLYNLREKNKQKTSS